MQDQYDQPSAVAGIVVAALVRQGSVLLQLVDVERIDRDQSQISASSRAQPRALACAIVVIRSWIFRIMVCVPYSFFEDHATSVFVLYFFTLGKDAKLLGGGNKTSTKNHVGG
jgi:hypothetical protein